MKGKINKGQVIVKYLIDEDDIHFNHYPIKTVEQTFNCGDIVEFELEKENYVFDDGSEEIIEWAVNLKSRL